MSLLNQMLKDLEKRQATAGGGQPPSENVLLSSATRRGFNGPMLLLVLVAVAAGAGVLVWINYQKPGAQPSAPQMTAANSQPKASPVKPVPATGNGLSPSPSVSVMQAASEVVSIPTEPPTATLQSLKPEVAAVRKDLASTAEVISAPQGGAKVAEEKAATKPVMIALANEKSTKDSSEVFKQVKPVTQPAADQSPSFKVVRPAQRSNNLYKQAISLLQQSRTTEAQNALKQAIGANSSNHGARQLLAELLVDAGRNTEAATLLREGLDIVPGDGGFSLALARLQVANGAKEEALSTLEQGMSSAENDVEYHAFFAALLQNQGRHAEAVQHYITALRSNPSMPNWLIGAGISLQAENKMSEAAEAFQRAIDTGELTSEVAQFAGQRLKQIRQQR